MNKTISINLGGSVFNIEEDAFFTLRTYLENIKANFTGDPAGEEIMQDIEVRIAELFNERMNERKNVVVRTDVDEVVSIMGQPEDYKVDADDNAKNKSYSSNTRHKQRRLYRDEEDKVLSGVCAGLSHYFRIDPIVVRLLVVLIFFISGGTAILGYILFWALVPKAETTAEKLQMRGETVDINNITRMVNDEAKASAERINKFGQKTAQQVRYATSNATSGIGRALSILFGFIIMMIGFGLLIGLLSMLIVSDFNFFGFGENGFDTLNNLVFSNDGTLWMLATGVVLAMGAPAVALIYLGIKLITASAKKIKGLGLSLLSLFIIGVVLCLYGGIKTGKQFSCDAEITTSALIDSAIGDTLFVSVLPDTIFSRSSNRNNDFGDLTKITESSIYYGEPLNLHFEPTNDDSYKVQVRKSSQGRSNDEARGLCKNISYDYFIKNDSATFASFFTTPSTDKFRAQHIEVIIYVPVGKYIALGSNIRQISWAGDEGEVLRMDEHGAETEHYIEHSLDEETDSSSTIIETKTVNFDDGELTVKKEVKRKKRD